MATNHISTAKDNTQNLIKFAQINLHHSRAATASLMKYIADNNVDITCIQEPYTRQRRMIGIPKFHKTLTAGEDRSRAAIIVTNNRIDATVITQLSDADAVTIEITKGDLKIIIASMYLDRCKPLGPDMAKIEAILQHAKGLGVTISMDSNARSTLWHDTISNNRGKELVEFITSRHLHIMNEESINTTFCSRRGSSNIDLTLINYKLLRRASDWEICEEESNSDHNIIKYTISTDIKQTYKAKTQEERYIVNKESLEKYHTNIIKIMETKIRKLYNDNNFDTNDLDDKLNTLITRDNEIEKQIDEFSRAVKTACETSFKRNRAPKTSQNHKSIPWWTQELTAMRKRTNALRRKYQRARHNAETREAFKTRYLEEKARYAATIKREKTRSWKEYCNLTNSANPWNEVYRLAAGKGKTPTQITTLRRPDGTYTVDTKETLKLMLEYFTPDDKELEDNDHHKHIRVQTEHPPNTQDDREFTIEEIRNIIEGMDGRKAPGEDGITGEIYKHTFNIFPKSITAMYNGCLRQGVFPKRWKNAKIIPISKPGKENSEEASKYRPISLINIGGKVLEKALINRINYHVYSTDYLNHNQYGFTPQTSTIDAIKAATEFIEEGFSRGEITATVSLDVEGAFNSAWPPSVLYNLQECECPRNLYNLTRNYFSQRTATMSNNNIKLERIVNKGCPQGSHCGPGLWNIFYNSLLRLKFLKRTKVIAFADDILLLTRAKTVREVENIANIELRKISAWAKDNKTRFNDQKSKVMLMTRRKRRERKDLEIYLNNKPLKQVNNLKYLGVIIDSKLTFRDHINHVTEKCTKLIFTLSKSAKLTWGLNHAALKTIYTGGILPLLLYGAPVWANIMDSKCYRQKIARVQRLINIKIAKAYRTVSHEALCILTGLTPIHIKIDEAAQLYQKTRENRYKDQPIDHDKTAKHWLHPAVKTTVLDDSMTDTSVIQIFTDGSKSEHGVGAGFAILNPGYPTLTRKFRLHNRCTNNQAEQIAILKSLEYAMSIQLDDKTATVYTDSQTTLDSLINNRIHTSLIEEIRRKAHEMEKEGWKIRFRWIKGHAGTWGNELADQLAKEAAANTDIPTCYNRVPKSVVKSELKAKSVERWQSEWNKTTKGKITKDYFPEVTERLITKINITPNLTTMITGHGNTKTYLYRFKIIDSPECPCGHNDQTTDHILLECTLLSKERDSLISAISRTDDWPTDKHKLITKHYKAFTRFANQISFDKLNAHNTLMT